MEKSKLTNEILDISIVKMKGYEGYRIKTEQDNIKFVVDNSKNVGELWGYLSTPEDLKDYIGVEYLGYTSDSRDKTKVSNSIERLSNCQFLNIKTSNGDIDFVVYNACSNFYHKETLLIINNKIISSEII